MPKDRQFSVRSKVWLEMEGEPVFGEGRRRLLEAIDRLGSITRAASHVGVSYRRAWSFLRAMEDRLGMRLVETQRGGENGGGARLTDEARVLLKDFEELLAATRETLKRKCKDFFDHRYARLHDRGLTTKK